MVPQRLKEYIDKKGISISAFEKSIGMSNASFHKAIKNNGAIGSDKIEKILKIYSDLNPIWLLTGKGNMIIGSTNEISLISEPLSLYKPKADAITIPIVEIEVAAGPGAYNNDHLEEVDTIEMPSSMVKMGSKYLGVRVRGSSMEPTLQRDSYVVARLLDPSEWTNIKDGYVYIVTNKEGESVIKRLKNRLDEKGFIVCMSDNPDKNSYANYNIGAEEINTVWYAEWNFRSKLNNIHDTYYYKQTELEEKYEDVSSKVSQIMRVLNIPNIH